MGLLDTFGFSSKKYARHLKEFDDCQLKKKYYQKRTLETSTMFATGAGIGGAPSTMGISLVGSASSIRQTRLAERQRECIELELVSRGCEIPRQRAR